MWRLPISLLRLLYRSTNHEAWRGFRAVSLKSTLTLTISITVSWGYLFLYLLCEMDDTPRNRAIMERYKTLVTTQYKEPGQDGKFDDCTKDVLEELCEDDYSDAEEELEPNVDTD
ncbi:hypothetical protein OS493_025938 [Desmophyllum pertusum]|uniref:Uncharacterized protein n=1 Tax=Desmophyllum pertusum TaxID=174260 RepID=A0A9W9YMD8_9CNID|nr:hypothetical protein OS493_025938 [Desmophyllum pertusum]